MRIIKANIQEKIRKCSCCKSVIAYNCRDIKKDILGNFIRCPVCGKEQSVSIFDKKVKR